jgi:predicted ATPase
MELLYLWIEDYNNIQNQGFNFSSKWKFDYQNEQLTVEERPNAIDNFFGEDIVNITALVGANGSGKTSVLEFIYDRIFSNDNDPNGSTSLLVHKQSENIVKYSNFRKSINDPDSFFFFVVKNTNEQFLIEDIKSLTITEERFEKHPTKNKQLPIVSAFPITSVEHFKRLPNSVSLFYSPFLNRNKFNNKYCNISTAYLLDNSYNSTSYFSNEDKKFITFLNCKKLIKKLPFFIDRPVSIFFTTDALGSYEKAFTEERLEKFNKDYAIYEKITDKSKHTFSIEGGSLEDCLKLSLLKSLIVSSQRTLAHRVWVKNHPSFIKNISIYKEFDNVTPIPIDKSIIILEKYLKNIFSGEDIDNLLILLYNFIDTRTLEHGYFINTTTGITSILFKQEKQLQKMLKSILDVRFQCEENEIKSMPFFHFLSIDMQGMSSGEQQMLQLFARFYSFKDYVKNIPYLLILIDEGETSLHPQWQKQYIKLLKETLPLIFKNTPIQIILSSHSPFIVSDLPKENIIFLDTDKNNKTIVVDGLKQKETFGANIHTLFTDAFFMDGGLMGDFAKEQINAVIDFLNNKPSSINSNEKAQKYINLIGEPIIKRQLQKMLDSLRLTKADNNEKDINKMKQTLDLLKEQVRLLENQINPSSNDSDQP